MTPAKKNFRDLILVLYGGGTAGVFGAGVVSEFDQQNFDQRIHSIYGISAGAHNGAYLIAKQTSLGSSIYYENLIDNNFFHKNRLPLFLIKGFLKIIFPAIELPVIMDIDYLIEIEKSQKALDVELIKKSKIKFFVKLFQPSSREYLYARANKNSLDYLRAASAAPPFYSGFLLIHGRQYTDSSAISDLADSQILSLAKDNPEKKIVIVLNTPHQQILKFLSVLGNTIWAIFVGLYFRSWTIFISKLNIVKRYKNLKKLISLPNVYLISNPKPLVPFENDPQVLKRHYRSGIQQGRRFLRQIGYRQNCASA